MIHVSTNSTLEVILYISQNGFYYNPHMLLSGFRLVHVSLSDLTLNFFIVGAFTDNKGYKNYIKTILVHTCVNINVRFVWGLKPIGSATTCTNHTIPI